MYFYGLVSAVPEDPAWGWMPCTCSSVPSSWSASSSQPVGCNRKQWADNWNLRKFGNQGPTQWTNNCIWKSCYWRKFGNHDLRCYWREFGNHDLRCSWRKFGNHNVRCYWRKFGNHRLNNVFSSVAEPKLFIFGSDSGSDSSFSSNHILPLKTGKI